MSYALYGLSTAVRLLNVMIVTTSKSILLSKQEVPVLRGLGWDWDWGYLHYPRRPCGKRSYAISSKFLYRLRGLWINVSFFLFLRYVDQGGNTALQDNEDRITELKGRAQKLKMDKEAVSNEIDKLKNDISKQQVSLVHCLFSNSMSYFQLVFAIR